MNAHPKTGPESRKPDPAAAKRAKEEAEARRLAGLGAKPAPCEVAGRGGLDPVRYGDWEHKGLTSDF